MSRDDKLNLITKETGVSLGLLVVLLLAAASTFAWIRSEVADVRNHADVKISELRSELQTSMNVMNTKLDATNESATRALIIIERVDRRTQQIEADLRNRSNGQ